MTWPRYKLNYAFNTREHLIFQDVRSSEEVIRKVSLEFKACRREEALHIMLSVFLTSEIKKVVQEVKTYLISIANEIYGNVPLDGDREAFLEAIDINIVYCESLSRWDYDQWTLKENLESSEEELF